MKEVISQNQEVLTEGSFEESLKLLLKYQNIHPEEALKTTQETELQFTTAAIACHASRRLKNTKIDTWENLPFEDFIVSTVSKVSGKIIGLSANPIYKTEKDLVVRLSDLSRYEKQADYLSVPARYTKAAIISPEVKKEKINICYNWFFDFVKHTIQLQEVNNTHANRQLRETISNFPRPVSY